MFRKKVTGYELQVTGCGLRVIGCELRVTGLPDYFYLIFGNLGIGRHNREPFQLSLSNEQSIEWVSMMIRKRGNVNPVRKASTFQRGGSFTPLEKVSNRVFALKGLWPGGNYIFTPQETRGLTGFIPAASSGAF